MSNRNSALAWGRAILRTWRLWLLTAFVVGLTYYGYTRSTLIDGLLLGAFSVLITLFALAITETNVETGNR
jgi:hypothetical protein